MPLLLQAATATVTTPAAPSITMAVIGVATGILSLVLAFALAVIYAYRMGAVTRDMEATKDGAVTANEALAEKVAEGFKSVHRRLDEAETERRETRVTSEERREELTRWRGATDQGLALALDLARRASRRAHRAATLSQAAVTTSEVHANKIATLEKNDDERRDIERRVGPPNRRQEA